MSIMSQLHSDLETIRRIMFDDMGEPDQNSPEETVRQTVHAAYVATGELYKLSLNPLTAPLLTHEEGDLWSIQGRVSRILNEMRSRDNA